MLMANSNSTVNLPATTVKVLGTDGAFSLPWRRYFQNLAGATNGNSGDLTAIEQDIKNVQVTVAQAKSTAGAALSEAQAASNVAAEAMMFDALLFDTPPPADGLHIHISDSPQTVTGTSVGEFLALTGSIPLDYADVALTGRPTAPTNPIPTDTSKQVATDEFVWAAIMNVLGSIVTLRIQEDETQRYTENGLLRIQEN